MLLFSLLNEFSERSRQCQLHPVSRCSVSIHGLTENNESTFLSIMLCDAVFLATKKNPVPCCTQKLHLRYEECQWSVSFDDPSRTYRLDDSFSCKQSSIPDDYLLVSVKIAHQIIVFQQ